MLKTRYTDKLITRFRKASKGQICVEFRYWQRRVYEMQSEQNKKVEYDATMVMVSTTPKDSGSEYPNAMLSFRSLNGKYSLSGVGPHLKVGGNSSDFVDYVYGLF